MTSSHFENGADEFIRFALNIGALEIVPEGRKLKSGRVSPYFFNSGLFNTGDNLRQLIYAYRNAYDSHPILSRITSGVVFGPAYKGIPLAVSLAMELSDHNEEDWGWAFNRKEEKTHGDGGMLVGANMESNHALIVDDVMTSGMSSTEAFQAVRAAYGTPFGVIIAFDRQEVGQDGKLSAVQEFEQKFGVPVASAATLEDLIRYMVDHDHENLLEVMQYQSRYGVKNT